MDEEDGAGFQEMKEVTERSNVARIEVYQDKAGEWRWRGLAANEEIVVPPEAHSRAEDASRAAHGVFPGIVQQIIPPDLRPE